LLSAGNAVQAAGVTEPQQFCKSLAHRLAHVNEARCNAAQLEVGAHSVQKRPLLVRDFPQTETTGGEPPRVLMVGAIHGDELAAVELVFDWMHRLDTTKERSVYWRVAPLVNPDGLFARNPTRVNAAGVDLNRNFPAPDAATQALKYWITKTGRDPHRYPGVAPASEPETRWLVEQIAKFQPDAIISVHAPYGVLDYDGPPEAPHKVGYLRLQPIGTYPGSLGDYAGLSLGLPVVTLELPQSTRIPTKEESSRMWADLGDWLNHHLPAHRHTAPAQTASAAINDEKRDFLEAAGEPDVPIDSSWAECIFTSPASASRWPTQTTAGSSLFGTCPVTSGSVRADTGAVASVPWIRAM